AFEVGKEMGTNIDDEPPPALDAKTIQRDLGIDDAKRDRYPDGYYQSKDGKTVVVALRAKVLGSDFDKGSDVVRRVRAVVDRVDPKRFDPSIRVGYAGDLYNGISEYTAINRDLTEVGYFGAILITGVVFLYYLRIRTLIAMVLTIGIGV